MNLDTIIKAGAVITAIGVIGSGTLYVSSTYATKDAVKVAETKADIAISEHIRYLSNELGRLESQAKAGKASQYDLNQIKYLQEKLEQLQKIQREGV